MSSQINRDECRHSQRTDELAVLLAVRSAAVGGRRR
jgi:hypothetical protein